MEKRVVELDAMGHDGRIYGDGEHAINDRSVPAGGNDLRSEEHDSREGENI